MYSLGDILLLMISNEDIESLGFKNIGELGIGGKYPSIIYVSSCLNYLLHHYHEPINREADILSIRDRGYMKKYNIGDHWPTPIVQWVHSKDNEIYHGECNGVIELEKILKDKGIIK